MSWYKTIQSNFDDNKMAKKWEDKIPGGLADKDEPKDYDKSDVEKGKNIELEHTNDADTAREIAIDHLKEHKDYYIGLEHMENALEEIEKRDK